AKISGIHVFGFNVLDIEKEYKRKNQSSYFKLFNTLGESIKEKHFCAFSTYLSEAFQNKIPNFFNSIDQPILQEIRFHIQDKDYLAKFNNKKNSCLNAFVKAIDQGPIFQDAYQDLATLQPELLQDHNNISLIITNEISHINNQEIKEEILHYIGKASYR
ncbi:17069_t:CDS:2, partial [Dentiscutata erythropus]